MYKIDESDFLLTPVLNIEVSRYDIVHILKESFYKEAISSWCKKCTLDVLIPEENVPMESIEQFVGDNLIYFDTHTGVYTLTLEKFFFGLTKWFEEKGYSKLGAYRRFDATILSPRDVSEIIQYALFHKIRYHT